MECLIYRGFTRELHPVYLYLESREALDRIPEEIKKSIRKLEYSFSFDLTPERRLERVSAAEVLKALSDRGWFLRVDSNESENLLEELTGKAGADSPML